jgi:uncharacterized protein with ATP-grasp and redox domains
MKIELECMRCIADQALESPRRFTDDPAVRERILRQALRELSGFDRSRTPPEMGAMLCRVVNEAVGDPDPFLDEKRRLNRVALDLLPELSRMVETAADPFAAAVRIAIAGNVIDFGAPGGVTVGVRQEIVGALDRPLGGDGAAAVARLRAAAADARTILYLTDNAGEIVLDRLLIERLPPGAVTVAVRSGPAINDALVEDAEAAGLDEIAEVIGSGSTLPGTLLDRCYSAFVERFRSADLIISKGQGNFETLSDERGPIFFLLRAKCGVVASQLGCEPGDYVVAEAERAAWRRE